MPNGRKLNMARGEPRALQTCPTYGLHISADANFVLPGLRPSHDVILMPLFLSQATSNGPAGLPFPTESGVDSLTACMALIAQAAATAP